MNEGGDCFSDYILFLKHLSTGSEIKQSNFFVNKKIIFN